MSRIELKFKELDSKNEKALIAYVMVGFLPDKDTISTVRGLIKGGADIIELGFPFSDPLADGPVIQNASTVSLSKGTKMKKFLNIVKTIRKETDIPLVLMTYANILYHKGYQKFINEVKKAGIDGLILPDMSVEESVEYLAAAKKAKVDTIFLVSPNTSKNRIEKILKASSGFLYLVAVYGTTGIKTSIQNYSITAVKTVKKITKNKIPIGIGFGVSTPSDVKRYVAAGANGVIVGSAFLRIMESTPSSKLQDKIFKFTKSLKSQTKSR